MSYKNISFSTNIIEHLGKDLITAPEVAFVELIKNSLDALVNSMEKEIRISYFDSIESIENNTLFPIDSRVCQMIPGSYRNKPLYLVEDMGCGMDEDALESGFLSVGTDIKKTNIRQDGSIILGQKGIGRLAAQRLGKLLLVETASASEGHSNVVVIEWEKVLHDKIYDVRVPYANFKKIRESYTRLWILDVNEGDLIREDGQIELFKDYSKVALNEDLDNAICFLISPFSEQKAAEICFFHNGHQIAYGFDKKMLDFAETVHEFEICNDKNGEICLKLNLIIKPWLLHRIHRASIQPQTEFVKYEKQVEDYRVLLEKNKEKLKKTFDYSLNYDELVAFLVRDFKREYKITEKEDNDAVSEYLENRVVSGLIEINKVLPIKGRIFSYRKDAGSCKSMINFANIQGYEGRDIQNFLKMYNGVKLYRDYYRIGFLGNKDNDWLKLQQYRTKGQQFYRFNLGTTLGFVSINDPYQKYIKEISSRLDINRTELSNMFLRLVEKVCNDFFFDFNEAINEMVKNILFDEGWLQGNTKQKVLKEEKLNDLLLEQNVSLGKKIEKTMGILMNLSIGEQNKRFLTEQEYDLTLETLKLTNEHFSKTEKYFNNNAMLLSEAKAGLEKIEIEAFNNYKLMANGLITETITHELHSLVSTTRIDNAERYISNLTEYLWDNNIELYNSSLLPLDDSYHHILHTLDDVSNLYKFLEKTFIKNNSKDEYEIVNVSDVAKSIESRLSQELKKTNIKIIPTDEKVVWHIPKGVLLHVLYNLVNNSKYWIDIRRKRSLKDKLYYRDGTDYIKIESDSLDSIIIYDSGTGVKREMEEILFQPLQSGKGPDGRGMGLYIVKKLLNSFSANIELLNERNIYGNRYKFKIEVPEECIG